MSLNNELKATKFMMLGMLEESAPAVKEHYNLYREEMNDLLKDCLEKGGVGSDAFAGLTVAANLFLIEVLSKVD